MFNENGRGLVRVDENQDILDLSLGVEETKRLIRLRLMAKEIVKGATLNSEGLDRLRKTMRFLNNEIELSRNS